MATAEKRKSLGKLDKQLDEQLDKLPFDKERLKQEFDLSHFDLNQILRGIQLTLVGVLMPTAVKAHRALQNPALFTSDHYRQAGIAVLSGLAIRLVISIPIIGVRVLLWTLSLFVSLDHVTWDDQIVGGLNFIEEYVLQVPFFLMALMRYVTPTLDNMFMDSLNWVDKTYVHKHKNEDPDKLRDMYYPNLRTYKVSDGSTHTTSTAEAISMFLYRFARKGAISLAVFALSYLPFVGRFVLPAASFYTFNKAVGLGPASLIFGTGIFLPKRYIVIFLQSYFASRSLMRELLEPYFSRVHFTKEQKKNWFRNREGILFGFAIGFYTLIKIPLVGVLIYGIAEASTAYLITKITDPPPPATERVAFAESQQEWTNKHEFLNLSLSEMDAIHLKSRPPNSTGDTQKHE
ncbi:Transmembrane protein UsgS [Colletotrichum higginsianum IMI 349063]|uniref:Transmembrane protein UsgS n=1 Tax=Colletotrichum higginsianum (strain IMI 349063) TaxID=759273 RepID=A0A1B7XZP2_COLHI|nr:Transmembrane protein UsgS [Colletotrichum higginsianum IMI 349063]OBR05226.1 Transmembrane protein UsgS [Colletotrichum higginsianum IMI 349063]